MKLEIGKKYVLNNGEKHVCERGPDDAYILGGCYYYDDGQCVGYDTDAPLSVSHEYTQTEGNTLAELDVNAGDVVECVKWDGFYWTNNREYKIQENNKIQNNTGSEYNISSVGAGLWRIISRAADTPTLWRDMTDAEKGALLLAKHEGKAIDQWNGVVWCGAWKHWYSDYAYRIKPTPKVEVVTVCDDGIALGSGVSLTRGHRITFTTTDGKPDTASIRMEEL